MTDWNAILGTTGVILFWVQDQVDQTFYTAAIKNQLAVAKEVGGQSIKQASESQYILENIPANRKKIDRLIRSFIRRVATNTFVYDKRVIVATASTQADALNAIIDGTIPAFVAASQEITPENGTDYLNHIL